MQTPGRFPRMGAVASELGIGVRSLRRHLSENGVSYQELLGQVRRDLAVDYQRNSLLTVEQIAQLVGFVEASSFRKAFHRWTGETPCEFREPPAVGDSAIHLEPATGSWLSSSPDRRGR